MSAGFPIPVPGFTLGACLGDGATASVYAARHDATGQEVAVKLVPIQHPRMGQALEAEVLAMARLNHPHVLVLHDAGRLQRDDREIAWLAMEQVDGGTYEGWQPASWAEVEPVFEAVASGLAHAHARGVVHRDLKPANLLRALPGTGPSGPKLADFGLTVVRGRDAALPRGGTPRYMPREQVESGRGRIGPWSDLYALGCTLWEWVCGAPPFDGPPSMVMFRQIHTQPGPFHPRFEVPDGLETLVRSMLAKAPGERPASVGALWRALGRNTGAVADRIARLPSNRSSHHSPGLGVDLLALRSTHTVGRQAQRALLMAALQEVVDTNRSAVRLLQGTEGVGRRHLLRWLAESAHEAGVAEVVWNPEDLGEVRSLAASGPTIVVFENLDAQSDELLAGVAFAGQPVLGLAPCLERSGHEDLLSIAGVEAIDVDPLADHELRQILTVELGVAESLGLRMVPACQGLPGLARRWLEVMSRDGRLVPRRDGFAGEGPLGAPPDDDDDGVPDVLAATDPTTRRALQAAAAWGTDVPAARWRTLAAALGADPDQARLEPWLRRELLRRSRDGSLIFRSERAREVLRRSLSPGRASTLADAIAEATPEARWVRGMLLLDAGRFADARNDLLYAYDIVDLAQENRNRRAVERLRPHMADATLEERVLFEFMDMRTALNLTSGAAAVPLADRLVHSLDRAEAQTLPPALISKARELAALVYAFEDQPLKGLRVLETTPETSSTLRARAMFAEQLGEPERAVSLFERALALEEDPRQQARLLNGLGAVHGRQERHLRSAACFDRCADLLDPELRYIPLGNLAACMIFAGRPDEALAPARQAWSIGQAIGPRRVAFACINYAVAAALTDSDDLDAIHAQALYALRRWRVVHPEAWVAILDDAHPVRPEGRAFLAAVREHVTSQL